MSQPVIREMMSMCGLKFQVTKKVYRFATTGIVGDMLRVPDGMSYRYLSLTDAQTLVAQARQRMALVDEGS